jgi:uncharacterized protein involved in exopolysaccharide biosynthesis
MATPRARSNRSDDPEDEAAFVAPRAGSSDLGARYYLRALRKHRWLVLTMFVLTVIVGATWTARQTPIFSATATVLIEPEPPRVLNIQEVTPLGAMAPWDPNYYATQHEVIRSEAVLHKAAETLKLGERLPGAKPLGVLQGALQVEPRRNTRLVYVRAEHPDPLLARDMANAVAGAYVKHNLDLKLKGAREAVSWLTEEAGRLQAGVQASAVALQDYRVKSGILGLQEQRQITAQKIMDANKAYVEAQAARLSLEARLRQVKRIARDPDAASNIITSPETAATILKLKTDLVDLEAERARALKVYKDKHPEVVKLDVRMQQVNDRIGAIVQSIVSGVETEQNLAVAREATLLDNVNRLRNEGQHVSEKEIQYLTLQRDLESNQQLYDAVLKRLKETGLTGGLETNNVTVLEEAKLPGGPIRPNPGRNLLVTAAIGLALGLGLALGIEYFDTRVNTPDDVERYFGLPVVGVVPGFDKG